MDQKAVDQVNREIASLRGQGRLDEAIARVREMAPEISEDQGQLVILQQGFQAAQEAGKPDVAREFAEAIFRQDPGVPSVRKFLGK